MAGSSSVTAFTGLLPGPRSDTIYPFFLPVFSVLPHDIPGLKETVMRLPLALGSWAGLLRPLEGRLQCSAGRQRSLYPRQMIIYKKSLACSHVNPLSGVWTPLDQHRSSLGFQILFRSRGWAAAAAECGSLVMVMELVPLNTPDSPERCLVFPGSH